MSNKKSLLYKMLKSDNSLTRSLGDLSLNIIKATGAEKRTREKLEKIEIKQIEELNTLIEALSKHVIKYKICDKHLKKYFLENKHKFLGTLEFFNSVSFRFINQFNEFVHILRIYKGLCKYLDPKKLIKFIDLIFKGDLDKEQFVKYEPDFLLINRTPICNLALEDASEESSEKCSSTNSSQQESPDANFDINSYLISEPSDSSSELSDYSSDSISHSKVSSYSSIDSMSKRETIGNNDTSA